MYNKYIFTCQAKLRSGEENRLFLAQRGGSPCPNETPTAPSGTESEALETGDLTTAEQPCRIGQTSAVAIRFGQLIESEFAS
jgi:hypothetical protein